jgi:hypothetical protein
METKRNAFSIIINIGMFNEIELYKINHNWINSDIYNSISCYCNNMRTNYLLLNNESNKNLFRR